MALDLHVIHSSEITTGFWFIEATSELFVWISKSISWLLGWLVLSEDFCSVCIISHTADGGLSLLWSGWLSCSSRLFCFLLFFNGLKLFDFIVLPLLKPLHFIFTFCLHRVHFYWAFWRRHGRTSINHLRLSYGPSLSSHILFGLLGESPWSWMVRHVVLTWIMGKMGICHGLTSHSSLHLYWTIHIFFLNFIVIKVWSWRWTRCLLRYFLWRVPWLLLQLELALFCWFDCFSFSVFRISTSHAS